MADLLSLLGLGAGAMTAQNAGAAVAGNNTANVNTDGYARERIDLESMPQAPLVGGVWSGGVQRLASNLIAMRQRTAAGASGKSQAFATASADLEAGMTGGPQLDDVISMLFGAVAKVAASPTDPVLRKQAVAAAQNVASAFQQQAGVIAQARGDADARIKDDATQATALAAQIASYNKALAGGAGDPTIQDKRDQATQQLIGLTGGSARIDPDGAMRVVLDGGAVMVDGAHSAKLVATPDPATGYARVDVVDGTVTRDVTAQLQAGAIAGELQLRDGTAAQAAAQLDQLAYDTATAMNAVHAANAGLDGVTGRDLFAAPAAVAGAAAAFAVDPAIAADPSKLAAAAPGTGPGDASGALALLAVKDAKVAGGGTRTLGDGAIDVVATVGEAAQTGKADAARDAATVDHLAALRDSTSGVDLNEELTNLTRFQNASAAATRFISTVDAMLSDLLAKI
jgi:flagellar hook-associated protein 1 FlgK